MIWRIDKTLGYVYTIDISNPYGDVNGKVYQHHHVMCNHIGRRLNSDECVHHIDRDKTNNDLSNLQLMTYAEHAKLHAIEDRGYVSETRTCTHCNKLFEVSSKSDQEFCSAICASTSTRKFDISREELYTLVWSMSTVEVAKYLGVSDVAVAKRCKLLNVPKPPRGYWNKIKAGQQINITPLS